MVIFQDWNSVIWTYIKFIFGLTNHTHPPLVYGPVKKYADSISDKDFAKMVEVKRSLMQKFDVRNKFLSYTVYLL